MVGRVIILRETPSASYSYTIYSLDRFPRSSSELDEAHAHSKICANPQNFDGHWIIEQVEKGDGRSAQRTPKGIAHTYAELIEKVYDLATQTAQRYADKERSVFEDLTNRRKVLEQQAACDYCNRLIETMGPSLTARFWGR